VRRWFVWPWDRNAYEADLRAMVDGYRGYQRNPDAGTDQTEQAGELSALENYLRRDARAVAGGYGVFAETMAVTK
jgi:hypothetical protein